MPGNMGAIGGVAGGIIGGVYGGPAGAAVGAGIGAQAGGMLDANQANLELTEENRRWLEYQQNTAHWREVQDLKHAGLNPILSVNSGAQSAAPPTTQVQNAFGGMGATAMEATKLKGELALQQSEIAKKDAEIKNIQTDTLKSATETQVMKKGIPESEMKNDIYDIIRPWVKKVKEGAQNNSFTNPTARQKASRERANQNAAKYLREQQQNQQEQLP